MDLTACILADVPTIGDTRTKKVKKPKSSWMYEETMGLINLMGTESVQKKLDGMIHNHAMWQDVAAQLIHSAFH